MSRVYRIEIHKEAEDDLYHIYRYIAQQLQAPATAQKIYRNIKKEILSLRHMPERIGLMQGEPWHSYGFRKLVVGKYLVFYLVQAEVVHILRICYGGMNLERELQSIAF